MLSVTDIIQSQKNPRIKNFQHLQKAHERRKQNVFMVEGLFEIEKMLLKDYTVQSVFFCPELIEFKEVNRIFSGHHVEELFEVSKEVYQKIAYRENSGGIIALAQPKTHRLSDLQLPQNPLLLILESVEKPGNLGAMLRTADAAGIDAVIVCDTQTDLYNPNTVRSSIGCLFTVPVALADSTSTIQWLNEKNIQIFCTYLQASVPYHTVDYSKASAIVMGTEATGLTETWVKAATQNIIIPMRGIADSMNVSTAAAVVIFEACRQRNFK